MLIGSTQVLQGHCPLVPYSPHVLVLNRHGSTWRGGRLRGMHMHDATEDGERDDRRATTLIDAVAAAPDDDDDDGYPFLCLDVDAPVVGGGRRSHLFLRHWAPL